ncbi:MAG: hypothetical protein GX974_06585 [Clostridiales bacterium]|nr:hypothetical protein [Clostridiales bacterium]
MKGILERYGAIFLMAILIMAVATVITWMYISQGVKQQDDFNGAVLVRAIEHAGSWG